MRLRSLICGLALAAAATASAGVRVTSANTCGLMNVPSDVRCTMIAVPWLNVGEGNVQVAKLVKTDTLTAGDKLYYYNGSAFEVWELQGGAWTAVTTVGEVNGVTTAAAAADKTIARGQALWLERSDVSKEIWLYGQYTAETAASAVAAGTAGAPAFTMIANPLAADFDLNAKSVKGAAQDMIVFPSDTGASEIYTYNGTAWTKTVVVTGAMGEMKRQTTEGCTIPAGKGAWYVSKGGAPTIAWN